MISNILQTVYRTGSRILGNATRAKMELKMKDIQQEYLGSALRFLLILSEKSFGLSMAETLEILTWNCMIQVTVCVLGQ